MRAVIPVPAPQFYGINRRRRSTGDALGNSVPVHRILERNENVALYLLTADAFSYAQLVLGCFPPKLQVAP